MAEPNKFPPEPEALKEGEILPGQKKDKEWMAEREPAPEPEALKAGESMPETRKAGRHDHRWQGFRGGGVSTTMCVVCGKAKDTEVTEEQAPAPEPVEIEESEK